MIIFDLYNEILSEEESQSLKKEDEENLKQKLIQEILTEKESLQVINIYGEIVSY